MPSILTKLSKVSFSQRLTVSLATAFSTYIIYKYYISNASQNATKIEGSDIKRKAENKAHVNRIFFRKLWKILKILVPKFLTKESGYLCLVGLVLISRTYADVWMITNGTAIESAIISRDVQLFKHHLLRFILAMPAMANLDNRLANPDQILTQDVEKFCDCLVELYSNLSKPILDVFLYVYRLTGAIGFQGPSTMLAYLFVSGIVLTWLRRPLGRMTVREQQLEGEFRHINARIITNSEEIAFYQGSERERLSIMQSFQRLFNHLRRLVMFRFSMGIVDNIVAKYFATVIGYLVVSRPFLDLGSLKLAKHTQKMLLEDYYKSGRMLVRLAQAVGRLALSGRDMTRLAGFTERVSELILVLNDLKEGRYKRTMVSDSKLMTCVNKDSLEMPLMNAGSLVPNSGKIIIQDYIIKFENVPLVTPNGDCLIESMNFEVRSGINVLVCGPNGCGKSSLFRILGELWPLFGGTLTKPAKSNLFYIPQRPYMTVGTLRDQVIYPHNQREMLRRGKYDDDLVKLLDLVSLTYILEREGGWDVQQDWMDVLSGGEKQRIAMARLFYHQPQFAILDECTSAVSVDVEGEIYNLAKQVGITLFTVSHRKSLWKHHEYYLHMDGRGNYKFKPIDENTDEFGS